MSRQWIEGSPGLRERPFSIVQCSGHPRYFLSDGMDFAIKMFSQVELAHLKPAVRNSIPSGAPVA